MGCAPLWLSCIFGAGERIERDGGARRRRAEDCGRFEAILGTCRYTSHPPVIRGGRKKGLQAVGPPTGGDFFLLLVSGN